jgi:O-antigen ligase
MIIKIKSDGIINFIKNHTVISLLVLIMPLSGTPIISENILGLTGLKLINIIALFVLTSFLFRGSELLRYSSILRARATIVFFIYILIFSVEFFRSGQDLTQLAIRSPDNFGQFQFSMSSYVLSHYIKPLLFTVSFIYIINHIKSLVEIEKMVDLIVFSIFIFAVFTLMVSGEIVLTQQGTARGTLNSAFNAMFSLHYNTAGSILMLGVPLAFARAINKGKSWYPFLAVIVLALLFTQSRGAMLGALFGIISLLYFEKRLDKNLLIILLLFVITIFSLSGYIMPLFSKGIETGDIYQITSGRVGSLWKPLLSELSENNFNLIFGFGLYGLINSDSYIYTVDFFRATHAHNASIDFLVDGGLIVFIPYVFLLFYSLRRSVSLTGKFNNSTFNALVSCLIVYLIASMSGRRIFPSTENMMLFPIIALLVSFIITKNKNDR